MITVILVIHLLIAIVMVGLIMLQRSEGGGLGIGGGGGGGFMTSRATANLLTRSTGILATAFMVTSLLLAILSGNTRDQRSRSIMDQPASSGPAVPVAPSSPAPAAPAVPVAPSAPIAQ